MVVSEYIAFIYSSKTTIVAHLFTQNYILVVDFVLSTAPGPGDIAVTKINMVLIYVTR